MNKLIFAIKNTRVFIVLFLSVLFLSLTCVAYAQTGPAQIIPDFTFTRFNGQHFSRKDLTVNKKMVIVFFDVSCDHCQNELKAMSNRFDDFKKAEFYLVSMDNVPSIQAFMKKFAPKMQGKANVTLLRDVNRQFIVRFRPIQFPATYVYDSNKRLVKYFGQNSKVADIITAVNK
ncbi:MAG: redoxin domain-containing protein [Bacteroidota bacterium]